MTPFQHPAFYSLFLTAGIFSSLTLFLCWIAHRLIRNAGMVDIGWILSLVGSAWIYEALVQGSSERSKMLAVMVTIWGIRLSLLLIFRILKTSDEDPRYQKIREGWGDRADFNFFWFFQLQALIACFLSLPFLLSAMNPEPKMGFIETCGFMIWAIGFMGESASDRQLRAFKANPANQGKPCSAGFWKYSRHPNYFFEWVIWIGYFVFTCASPWGWVSAAAPLLMLYFLTCVSGIPPAEARALQTKGGAYRLYQKNTSTFIPWFPKKV